MLAVEEPNTFYKFRISLFIIISVISIIRIILSYIDKQQIDPIFIADIVISIVLILSMTLNVILTNKISKCILVVLIGFLWLANFGVPLLAYKNYIRKDYYGINIFIIVFRIFALFAYNALSMFQQ